jgi:hypothetical protein
LVVEEISLSGNRQDIVLIPGVVLQGATEQVDVLGEIALFDYALRPDAIQDLFLPDHLSSVLDEKEKDLLPLVADGDLHSLLQEAPRLWFQ